MVVNMFHFYNCIILTHLYSFTLLINLIIIVTVSFMVAETARYEIGELRSEILTGFFCYEK